MFHLSILDLLFQSTNKTWRVKGDTTTPAGLLACPKKITSGIIKGAIKLGLVFPNRIHRTFFQCSEKEINILGPFKIQNKLNTKKIIKNRGFESRLYCLYFRHIRTKIKLENKSILLFGTSCLSVSRIPRAIDMVGRPN